MSRIGLFPMLCVYERVCGRKKVDVFVYFICLVEKKVLKVMNDGKGAEDGQVL